MKLFFRFIFVLLTLNLLFISCSRDEIEDKSYDIGSNITIQKYRAKYLEFPIGMYVENDKPEPDLVTLEFNNGKVSTKIGDFLYKSPSSGLSTLFSKDVHAEIAYNENHIIITKKIINSEYSINYKKEFLLDKNQIKKSFFSQYASLDTIVYYYNNQRISKTITKMEYPREESLYYYNSKNNLDSIVIREYLYDNDTGTKYIDYKLKWRKKIIFSNYDNRKNPFKYLIFFDESYYRALSANNYQKITYQSIDGSGKIYYTNEKSWNLFYKNGEVDFSQ